MLCLMKFVTIRVIEYNAKTDWQADRQTDKTPVPVYEMSGVMTAGGNTKLEINVFCYQRRRPLTLC